MRQDDYPHPVSDPAAGGIPEYADDDSTAEERSPSPREASGPDPVALPADRDDGPVAMEEFGTTAEEQRRGEPLGARLLREEPDIPAGAGAADAAAGQWDRPGDTPLEPDPGSSTDQRVGADPVTGGRVGRLVAPDAGGAGDTEKDEIAVDAGTAGGGASAEELAMHETRDDTGGGADSAS